MNQILFLEMNEKWQEEYLRLRLQDIPVCYQPEAAQDIQGKQPGIQILSVFVNSKVPAKVLELFPDLKMITTRSTGFDHIDIQAASGRGILVSNVPNYGENTVAEHTFALILSLSRNLRKAYFKTKDGNFSLDGLMGFDLKGKTLGVIGTGHIGLHVIHMARGFGLNVVAFDIKKNPFLSEVLGFRYVDFDELLGQSDILSLHVPYMKSTHHLINGANIHKIRPGAILVNTARGALVETAALVKALDEGILAGAGLDVLEGEEFILEEKRLLASSQDPSAWENLQVALKNHILLHRDNVIYTPHMAFYSKEAVLRILETTAGNIRSFLAGSTDNVVNPQKKQVAHG